nr:uncharacterized protein LOC111512325 [Leptinotarsa decemlineata]
MENTLIFFLKYGEEEHAVELPEYDTVEILKSNVYDMYGIPPHRQIIEGWKNTPRGDDDILQSCAYPIDINYLTIRRMDLFMENDTLSQNDSNSEDEDNEPPYVKREKWTMQPGMDEEMLKSRVREPATAYVLSQNESISRTGGLDCFSRSAEFHGGIGAACCCYDKIVRTNRNCGVEFNIVSLSEAVSRTCLTSIEKRKVLLLYFHKDNEPFSEIFLRNLRNPKIVEILKSSFFILGWDVENADNHSDIEKALNEFDLSYLASFVKCMVSAALLIQNIDGCIAVNSCMSGKISDKNFLTSLENVSTFLKSEKLEQKELENLEKKVGSEIDMDSTNYQKMMADMLGDRDYDSFDFDQHEELKKKIAFAMFGPPEEVTGYENKKLKKVEDVYESIMNSSNEIAKYLDRVEISFIYNCTEPLPKEKLSRAKKYPDYNPNTDLMPVPIFVLRKCRDSDNPCRIFIDDTGRTYQSWVEYINKNKLHECKMVLPRMGRYEVNDKGQVLLEHHLSPACGLDVKILKGVDIATTVTGLASGGVFIAAAIPFITVAPAVLIAAGAFGIGTGVYAIGRSIHTLIDRSKHKETLSFANSDARGAYLNILAGSLGFVGAGTNVLVSQLVANGVNISKGAGAIVNTIGIVNLGASGASVLNTGYDVVDRWINENETPSALTVLQLSSSILFFGNAVYSFKTCSTIVEETQAKTLKNYQDSLRSNRHRKTFNNLMKDTIRQNDGNTVKGKAEVISAIRKIANKDDVFAALTRTKKTLNENGVRFYASGGEITLNGQAINLNEFTSLNKSDVSTFLSNIPSKTTVSPAEVNFIKGLFANLDSGLPNIESVVRYAVSLLGTYDGSIQRLIIKAVGQLAIALTKGIVKTLEEICPSQPKYFSLLNVVMEYFVKMAVDLESQYSRWRSTGSAQDFQPYFKNVQADDKKELCIWFVQKAVRICFSGDELRTAALKELLSFFSQLACPQAFRVSD